MAKAAAPYCHPHLTPRPLANQGGKFAHMSDRELIAEISRQANELGLSVMLPCGISSQHDEPPANGA